MFYFFVFFMLSLAGFLYFLERRFEPVKNLPPEEVLSRLNETESFWLDFYESLVVPAYNFYRETPRPFVFKEIEKIARRTRIINLKLDCLLLRFTNYIKGKRELQNNHKCQTPYWQELQNSKNGVNHKENEPE